MKKIIITFLISHFSFLIVQECEAQIIHVPADQPTIQEGIEASSDGDTVLVANGTYLENVNFIGKAITLASNFIIDGDTNHINNTIIDGSQPANPDYGSVVTFITGEDTTSVLCGFTITGGTGMPEPIYGATGGGGIICYYTGAKIIHNKITGNVVNSATSAWGGGIFSFRETGDYWTIVENNTIAGNQCVAGTGTAQGGGLEIAGNARICGNVIVNNHCTSSSGGADGGGIFHISINTPADTLILINNWICNNIITAANTARGGGVIAFFSSSFIRKNNINYNSMTGNMTNGGGILIREAASTEITGNEIISNSATSGWGGGLAIVDGFMNMTSIAGNTFRSNANSYGGGFYSRSSYNMSVSNNIFDSNSSESGGAVGMYIPVSYENARPIFVNNSIVNNLASEQGGAAYLECESNLPVFFNCIFYENSAPFANDINYIGSSDPIVISYSDIDTGNIAGTWTGEENFNVNPGFIEGDTLFHLSMTSPCKNASIDSLEIDGIWYYAPLVDFDGERRPDPQYHYFDTGADESWEEPPAPSALEPDSIGEDHFIARWKTTLLAMGYRLDVAVDENFNRMVPGYDDLDVGNDTIAVVSGLESLTYYYRVRAYNALWTSQYSNMIMVPGVGIEKPFVQSSEFKVQSYPNPFSDKTTIAFYLPENRQVSLKVHDLFGREIGSLVNGVLVRGEHTFTLQAGGLQSGVYLFSLSAGEEVVTGKLLVQKAQ